ncbi:hypothetical protein GGR51DRAFT_237148 [Nemania sp. FL0031]|nr:hypothetical protein GGR51DRAFT_237148 [Nemania sp. FL0031]
MYCSCPACYVTLYLFCQIAVTELVGDVTGHKSSLSALSARPPSDEAPNQVLFHFDKSTTYIPNLGTLHPADKTGLERSGIATWEMIIVAKYCTRPPTAREVHCSRAGITTSGDHVDVCNGDWQRAASLYQWTARLPRTVRFRIVRERSIILRLMELNMVGMNGWS